MIKLTALEEEANEVLRNTLNALTGRLIMRETYMELMGKIRDMLTKLENKRGGCPTGRHSIECLCHEGKRDFSVRYRKKMRNA